MKSKSIHLILLTTLCASHPLIAAHAAVEKPFLVVIDPGHGGVDHGARVEHGGHSYTEKMLTLELAREVAKALQKEKIRAVLTRGQDKDLPLSERTAIANRLKADIFLSIHMNSSDEQSEGIETYILNNSSNASSKRLADLENSVLEGSIASQNEQPGVGLILKDLILDRNLKRSKNLACAIQKSVVSAVANPVNYRKKNRGVKQALFYVLLGADMPSVLVEAGFINNPRDRNMVLSKAGRSKVAKAMVGAIKHFKNDFRSGATLANCPVH